MPYLRQFAISLLSDTDAADDLVQDCISRALSKLDQFRDGTNMRAWLFTILHNLNVEQGRRRNRAAAEIISISGDETPNIAPPTQEIGLAVRDLYRAIIDRSWMRIAATFLLVTLGGLAGWGINGMKSADGVTERKFVNQALKAHVVFVSGGPNVHETAIGSGDRLTDVYSRQFNHPIKVPNLAGAGFQATGRRLVNDKGVPTAQFMYKDPAGRMVTLYVQAGFDRSDMTFRLLAEDDMVAFYWSDGPLA